MSGSRCGLNTVILYLWCYTGLDVIYILDFILVLIGSNVFIIKSRDEIDFCVELFADDVWEADDDKPGFLSVVVDSIDPLFLYKLPMSLPVVENSNKNRKYYKWGWMKKINKSKNVKRSILIHVPKNNWWYPLWKR